VNCTGNQWAVVVGRGLLTWHVSEPIVLLKPGTVVFITGASAPGYWAVREPIKFLVPAPYGGTYSGFISGISDGILRPLVDTDGTDETLEWAGKPNETTREVIEAVSA